MAAYDTITPITGASYPPVVGYLHYKPEISGTTHIVWRDASRPSTNGSLPVFIYTVGDGGVLVNPVATRIAYCNRGPLGEWSPARRDVFLKNLSPSA